MPAFASFGHVKYILSLVNAHTHAGQGSPPRSSTADYVRATGPKTLHAPHTLHFLPPHQYRALKEQEEAQRVSPGRELVMSGGEAGKEGGRGSFLAMRSLEFGGSREVKGGERERRA